METCLQGTIGLEEPLLVISGDLKGAYSLFFGFTLFEFAFLLTQAVLFFSQTHSILLFCFIRIYLKRFSFSQIPQGGHYIA